MRVLEHEYHRKHTRHRLDEAAPGPEALALVVRRLLAQARGHPLRIGLLRELLLEHADLLEDVDEGQQRRALAERRAAPRQHARAAGNALHQLARQSRLADACVADHHHAP